MKICELMSRAVIFFFQLTSQFVFPHYHAQLAGGFCHGSTLQDSISHDILYRPLAIWEHFSVSHWSFTSWLYKFLESATEIASTFKGKDLFCPQPAYFADFPIGKTWLFILANGIEKKLKQMALFQCFLLQLSQSACLPEFLQWKGRNRKGKLVET